MASDVELIISVATQGVEKLTDLSASLRQVQNTIQGISIPMTKLDAHTKALNKAFGITSRGARDHAKSLKEVVTNQVTLSKESRRIKNDIAALNTVLKTTQGSTRAFKDALRMTVQELTYMDKKMRGLRFRAFVSDLRNVSLKLQRIGKDTQFVGRNLLINLTAPIMLFGRMGLQALIRVDEQLIRLTKVLDSVAMSAEQAQQKLGGVGTPEQVQQMVDSFNDLNNSMTRISSAFGVSKDLIVGLASDFAELGLTTNESIIGMTELTAAVEKLGTMDMSAAQDLTQALYFQSRRALENTGAFTKLRTAREREIATIKAATTQMYMFNAIENTTALTLRDLGEAFPEVASMAISYGLSMTEAAALLAPMKSAGLDVGASANSIKVSLQRALSPTKQNTETLKRLAAQYGVTDDKLNSFNLTTKSGLTGLSAIVDVFGEVKESAAGAEGALQLMSDLFEKRQGPRMFLAIEQLNLFNKALRDTASNTAERQIADAGERIAKSFTNLTDDQFPKTIRGFKDIGIIARLATATAGEVVEGVTGEITQAQINAAKAVRKGVSDEILAASRQGKDLIAEVQTEAGRALFIQLAGAESAQAIAQRELDTALTALGVTIQKIKNDFKLFASEILRGAVPVFQKLQKTVENLYQRWTALSEETRQRVTKAILAIASGAALLAPLVLGIGLIQQVAGTLGKALFMLLPQLKKVDGGFVGIATSAKFAKDAMNGLYEKTLLMKQSRVATDIAGMIEGPLRPGFTSLERVAVGAPGLGSKKALTESIYKARAAKLGILEGTAGMSVSQQVKFFRAREALGFLPPVRGADGKFQAQPAELKQAFAKYLASSSKAKSELRVGKSAGAASRQLAAEQKFLARQPFFKAAGVSSMQELSPTGAVGRQQFMLRGRDITSQQARSLAMGGIGGRVTSLGIRGQAMGERADQFVKSINPVNLYKKSVDGAKAAVQQLTIKHSLFGATAPGVMAKARVAMMGFMNATKLGTTAIKLMKIALVSSGVGILLLGIAGAAVFIGKNFEEIKKKSEFAFGRIGAIIQSLKEAFIELIRPIIDMFALISGGGEGSEGAIDGIAKAFGKIAHAVSFVAEYIKKFVVSVIQPYLYAIINIVMAVVSAFRGEWGKAGKYLVAAISWAGKMFVNIIAGMLKGAVAIVSLGVKAMLMRITLIPKAFAGVAGFLGKFVPGLTAVSKAVNGVIDGMFAGIDAGKNLVNKGIDKAAKGIVNGLDKGTKLGIKKSDGELFKAKRKFQARGTELGDATGEAISNALGEGLEDGADKAAQKIKDAIKDLAQKLQDYVADAMKRALDKFVDDSVKALNKQKEAALGIFDIQLKTLDKLEQAEESLTRTKEYEVNRRKMIDERALNALNYVRNRALAIYEGRIDDARILDLEELKNRGDFQGELSNLEEGRRKDLAKENLNALKEAINEAKKAANDFFDESVQKFQESIKEITKFPPVTLEDYKKQLEQLQIATNQAADLNTQEFGKMFEDFTTSINDKMPNKVIGAFTTNLDELVVVAREKYGLGDGRNDSSVIGVTIGMLADIGGKFSSSAPTVLASFGQITGGISANFNSMKDSLLGSVKTAFLQPFQKALDEAEPMKVFNQAIKDGNQAILDSFRGTVGGVGSEVDNMIDLLTQRNKDLARLQAEAKSIMENTPSGGGGGGGAGASAVDYRGISMSSTSAKYWSDVNKALGLQPSSPVSAASSLGIRKFKTGGFVPGSINKAVPAILHGGEYVLNASAVRNVGLNTLKAINNARFSPPARNISSALGQGQSATTVNINVDTFIGEEEWFRTMMKSYNVNIAPRNQKLAGNEQRVLSSYNGMNQVI
jgi:TP901 family phage tail tape measure protein